MYRLCVDKNTLCPGAWYTDSSGLTNCGYDYDSVYNGLQVPKGTRYRIAEYEVVSDMYVATGTIAANTEYGSGGFIQFFIPGYESDITFTGIIFGLTNCP